MISAVTRNYRSKKKDSLKRAVFISFTRPVSKEDIAKGGAALNRLLNENYDSYVFRIMELQNFTASLLKLLLLFRNSTTRGAGLMIAPELSKLISGLNLDKSFFVDYSERAVLLKVDGAG